MAKKFVIILIATLTQMYLFAPQSFAQQNTQQMKTLDEFTHQNKKLDTSQLLYVFDRCVAVLIYIASSSSNSKDAAYEQFSNNARLAATDLSVRQAMIVANSFKDKEREMEFHHKLILDLIDFYKKRSENLYATGQSFEKDEFIMGDTMYCGMMKKTLDEMDKK